MDRDTLVSKLTAFASATTEVAVHVLTEDGHETWLSISNVVWLSNSDNESVLVLAAETPPRSQSPEELRLKEEWFREHVFGLQLPQPGSFDAFAAKGQHPYPQPFTDRSEEIRRLRDAIDITLPPETGGIEWTAPEAPDMSEDIYRDVDTRGTDEKGPRQWPRPH